MNIFTLLIGASALFIAGCAAYFSVRGIALTFGAVSAFTIPIIIMASSLEFGKLVAASFLYRQWRTCNKTLRTYLLVAVAVLIGITSAGIYGYLSQAFNETLKQVEGYEKQIASLRTQQREYDRQVAVYRESGVKGSAVREKNYAAERTRLQEQIVGMRQAIEQITQDEVSRRGDERERLNAYISQRREDVEAAVKSKEQLNLETEATIAGERERRTDERARLNILISQRRQDIVRLEEQKKELKVEADERVANERNATAKLNDRLALLDKSVQVYRDKGPGGFLKEDGFKKAAELLKTQASEREAIRQQIAESNQNAQKAREDLATQQAAVDARIVGLQDEIAASSSQITNLTTGGAERADNIRTALDNLQKARAAVDERIQGLEQEIREANEKITQLTAGGDAAEIASIGQDERILALDAQIAEANRKITEISHHESAFGPDSSAELEAKIGEILAKKETAEQTILAREGDIRATDIGSFKFIARALDSSVEEAEATGDPILAREAMSDAVSRVVKWFILVLVLVFDPLAVTLVVAYNASLLRAKGPLAGEGFLGDSNGGVETPAESSPSASVGKLGLVPVWLLLGVGALWAGIQFIGDDEGEGTANRKAAVSGPKDSRAFGYVPSGSFAACAFDGASMMKEVALPKVILNDFVRRAPFIRNVCWDPKACGVSEDARFLYFLKFPGNLHRDERESDVVFSIVFPLEDSAKLKDFVLRQLDLKSAFPEWSVTEHASPGYVSISHKSEHVALGFDNDCLVALTSWQSDDPSPAFLSDELRDLFSKAGPYDPEVHDHFGDLARGSFDFALSFDAKRFFADMKKDRLEDLLHSDLRRFLDYRILATCSTDQGDVKVDAHYQYEHPVLSGGFGVSVAGQLEKARAEDHAAALEGVAGEFMEIFIQKFDHNSVAHLLERVDLSKSQGFEMFYDFDFSRRRQNDHSGAFTFTLSTREPAGPALKGTIDLLVEALNPLAASSGSPAVVSEKKNENDNPPVP